MAAWGKAGAWAQDVEENEGLHKEAAADFPPLAAAMAKPKKKKETMNLAEFTKSKFYESGNAILLLPTGPRERTADELERERGSGLGGAFRGYGLRDRDGARKRESAFDSEDQRESRADSASHWGSSKASFTAGRGDRDASSRADDIEDWAAGKKFTHPPSSSSERRFLNGGGGFLDSSPSRADDSINWASQKAVERRGFDSYKEAEGGDPWPRRGGGRSGFVFFQKDSAGDGDRWSRRDGNNYSGVVRVGERPRLVLQPRTDPVDGSDNNVGSGRFRTSNPFGEARPREEVLAEKEKGQQDWKNLDSHGRKDTNGDSDSVPPTTNDHSNDRNWRKSDTTQPHQNSSPAGTVRAANGNDSSLINLEMQK